MDAYQSQIDLAYSDEPPLLLVASSDNAMRVAERAIVSSSHRIGARLPIEIARKRIAEQPRVGAVWIEIDQPLGSLEEELFRQVVDDVEGGRYGAVVSATHSLIDPLFAMLGDVPVQLISQPDEIDRLTALSAVIARHQLSSSFSEAATDRNAERLRQLSEEMSRIASTLARLSSGPVATPAILDAARSLEAPPLSADVVRDVIRARRLRARFFSKSYSPIPRGTCC